MTLPPMDGEWLGFEANLEEAMAQTRRAAEAEASVLRLLKAVEEEVLPPPPVHYEQHIVLENFA